MQAVRMHFDANNKSNINCAFAFNLIQFLDDVNCDLDITGARKKLNHQFMFLSNN